MRVKKLEDWQQINFKYLIRKQIIDNDFFLHCSLINLSVRRQTKIILPIKSFYLNFCFEFEFFNLFLIVPPPYWKMNTDQHTSSRSVYTKSPRHRNTHPAILQILSNKYFLKFTPNIFNFDYIHYHFRINIYLLSRNQND